MRAAYSPRNCSTFATCSKHASSGGVGSDRRASARAIDAETEARRVASIRPGIPAHLIPEGVLPVTALVQALHDEQPRRRSVLEDALTRDLDRFVLHPIHETPGDDWNLEP
jgi:hypothetical protein